MDAQARIGTDGGTDEDSEDAASGERILDGLPPEKLLDTNDVSRIRAGIHCMGSVETVKQYVAYENSNEQRDHILRLLQQRATELREQT
ncbi:MULTISPECIES: hypothetical protein [Halococcus]|uniref:DUF8129 domain-containing protein n=1 Tax=Halococcus salifodinae DSM 8989 TaxID=1227456 RepID=M0NCS8_9EURY|nr:MULTISPECIES: hypothetical protein [Halococcus]EMA54894.1 hypothetical protein C450_04433 [Halococcus salifodinae DSM 8989]